MKLVVISDTHTLQDQINLPEGDYLVHCGDFLAYGDYDELAKFMVWLEEIAPKYKKVIMIPGNHDICIEKDKYGEQEQLMKIPNLEFLIDREIDLEGYKLYGTPWVPEFGRWAFMAQESRLATRFSAIPDDTEILLCHGPAYGIMDEISRAGDKYHENVGSTALAKRITELPNLQLMCFGHIHEQYGIQKQGKVTFVNAAQLDDMYSVANEPVIIELEDKDGQKSKDTGNEGTSNDPGTVATGSV